MPRDRPLGLMAYNYDDELARYALMFGAATCGCVPHAQAEWKLLPYRLQQRFGGTRRGWPACPICAGEGVDSRITEACPCLHTTPCDPMCTCVVPISSSGCRRCCTYGSKEQQRANAEWLVEAGACR